MSEFDPLSHGPVPTPAPAALIRARGEQRRRRTRVASLVAAASLVASIGGVAAALSRGDQDALQYAPEPSASSCAGAACPQPTDVAPSSPDPTDSAGSVGEHLLVKGVDAAFVTGDEWTPGATRKEAFAQLVVCPTEDIGGQAGLVRPLERGSLTVRHQVIRYPDGAGSTVLRSLRESVGRCPTRADAAGEHRLTLDPAPGPDVVVVRDATDGVTVLWVVVAGFHHLSYLELPVSEQPRLAAWADAARFRLVCDDPRCAHGTKDPTGAEPGPLAVDDPLRLDGLGPVVIGMSLTEAQAAAGQSFTPFTDELGNGCGFVSPRSRTPAVSFMVVDGTVVRVDVGNDSPVRTTAGVGIGSTEEQVKAAYSGRVVVRPHAYTQGHYLRVTSFDGRFVLVLETDGAVVTLLRSGTANAAAYTEGCA